MQSPSSLFSIGFVGVHVVHPYSRIGTIIAWKKFNFILSDRSDFHMIDSLSTAVRAFARRLLMFLSDKMLQPRYVKLSTNFRDPLFRVEMSP